MGAHRFSINYQGAFLIEFFPFLPEDPRGGTTVLVGDALHTYARNVMALKT
jgi:hypothetical protein